MTQVIAGHTTSRRRFLAALGLASATAAAPVAVAAMKTAEEQTEPFKHPQEYLAAMQAIGWMALAMYQQRADGSHHRMGVVERAPSDAWGDKSWDKFHAIQMRSPVQNPADIPEGDWWKWVWQYLYDKGLREDVTFVPDDETGT